MRLSPLPLRNRLLPVFAVLVGAPITAEYLQAYLPSTGDLAVMLGSLLILGPLYGGAALIIREIAVRRGLGWSGILLLAAAFGLAMPGLVDLALFGERRDDVAYWVDMRQSTLIAPLGISAYTTMSWVAGHVLMSVGAPLAAVDALAPRHRGRPLLGRWGIATVVLLWLLAALLVRNDGIKTYGYRPSVVQTVAVVAVVAALVVAALFTALGRPVTTSDTGRPIRPYGLVLAGALGMFTLDALPWTWAGVAGMAALLIVGAVVIRRWATTRRWSTYEIGALAAGSLVGRTLIGFLSPVPEESSLVAKLGQNLVLLGATFLLVWLVTRRRPAARTRRGLLRRAGE